MGEEAKSGLSPRDSLLSKLVGDLNLVTPEQLKEAIDAQAREVAAGARKPRFLGAVLVSLGCLDDAQLLDLVRELHRDTPDSDALPADDLFLGKLLLKQKCVTAEQVNECLRAQAQAKERGAATIPRLGELLVKKGHATPDVIRRVLATQEKTVLACAACRKRYKVAGFDPHRTYSCKSCKGLLEPLDSFDDGRADESYWIPIVTDPERAPSEARPLGKYSLLKELGRGGMGIVYEALDTALNRKVAVKTMLASPDVDPEKARDEEERFLREARLSANLPRHPHIVSVYEAGAIQGKRYIAMELIQGQSLSKWRKSGGIPLSQQVALLRDVALAVEHAHKHGIVHRDLKPENILVDTKNQPHVTDFGLAKAQGQSLALTTSGAIMGTPAYMSPEQAQGLKNVDARTDVWSLGVMLFEILAGRPPFVGDTALEIVMRVVRNPVPSPSTVLKSGPSLPFDTGIENICLKALGKNPKDRYPNALALAVDLTKWLTGDELRVIPPPSRRKLIGKIRAGSRPFLILSALLGLILVAVIALAFSGSTPEPELKREPAAHNDPREDLERNRREAQRKLKEDEDRWRDAERIRAEIRDKEEAVKAALAREEQAHLAAELRPREEPPRKPETTPLPAPAEPLPSDEEWKQSMNLMGLIDPPRDAVLGTWSISDNELVSGATVASRIEIPYRAPEEYDFRIVFTRRSGNGDVNMMLTGGGRPFVWLMGGWTNTVFGFHLVAGAPASTNPTGIRSARCLEDGRMYAAVARVRKTGVQAYLDGQLMSQWKTDYRDMSMDPFWKLRDPSLLGLGAWGATHFHRVELLEVTGKGVLARAEPADATPPKPPPREAAPPVPPREHVFFAGDFKVPGAFRPARYAKGEWCLTSEADVDESRLRDNYVELQFEAAADKDYKAWIFAGACCAETFHFWIQAIDPTLAEPGIAPLAPVKPPLLFLKKTHAAHGGPKEPARWEWIALPLPKFPSPGIKKVRLLTHQKGFSVACAVVSPNRKDPPREAELKQWQKSYAEAVEKFKVAPTPAGHITREFWTGVSGNTVANLTSLREFPNKPSGTGTLPQFEGPVNFAENYGSRIRGYLHPPVSGPYVFWIASDDFGELWLGTGESEAGRTMIASVPGFTGPRQWTKYPEQRSAEIHLVKGRRYYVEALHKEGASGDHISVGWQLPNGALEQPIPGNRLSPFGPAAMPRFNTGGDEPEPGLIGHWKLDEESGTAARDASGEGRAGLLVNGPAWSPGKVGGALSFNGTGAHVRVDGAADLNLTGDLTISFWVKIDADHKDWVRLVGKGTTLQRTYGVWLEGNTGRLLFQQYDDKGRIVLDAKGQTRLETGVWYPVSAVINAGQGTLYLNGRSEASAPRQGTPAVCDDPLTFAYSGFHGSLAGALDDVRLYNRALTAAEISTLAGN